MSTDIRFGVSYGGLFEQGFRSPPTLVRFEGFESTTARLQGSGWRLACDESIQSSTLRLAIRHQGLEVFGVSAPVRKEEILRSTDRGTQHLIFYIQRLASEKYISLYEAPSVWHGIDATPTFLEHKPKRIEDLFLFTPASLAPNSQEIISDPETVMELLEKITAMQKPEMTELRKKQRRENSLTAVTTHAKIITFAQRDAA